MEMFKNEKEMLKELDDFIYKAKSLQGSFLRDELISRIKDFLKSQDMNGDQHDFVDISCQDIISVCPDCGSKIIDTDYGKQCWNCLLYV